MIHSPMAAEPLRIRMMVIRGGRRTERMDGAKSRDGWDEESGWKRVDWRRWVLNSGNGATRVIVVRRFGRDLVPLFSNI